MGKYLQDLMFRVHYNDKKASFSNEKKEALKSCNLIDTLFNLYLPKKIEIGENIWRFIVYLTFDKDLNGKTEMIGLCQDYYVFCDFNQLISLNNLERKNVLLNLFLRGIKECCNVRNYPFEEFRIIEQKILEEGIIFNNFFKDKKTSPHKKHTAQMKGYLSENYDKRNVSITVFDRNDAEIKSILIGNFDFRVFDKLKWVDNRTINVYHVNNMQSYKRKKVADDYFRVDIITESVEYNPITRESIFNHGVKLLTETNEYEKALKFINQAKEFGHKKADNILRNLEINPSQRDKVVLLQTPKRR